MLGNGPVRFGGRPHGKGPAQRAPRRAAHPVRLLTATGKVVKSGSRVAFTEGTVADVSGALVATASSTQLVFDFRIGHLAHDAPKSVTGALVVGALLPAVAITLLTVHAIVVALSANKQRSKPARIVLRHLLDTLRALYRCGQRRR